MNLSASDVSSSALSADSDSAVNRSEGKPQRNAFNDHSESFAVKTLSSPKIMNQILINYLQRNYFYSNIF